MKLFSYLTMKGPRRGVQTVEFLVTVLGVVGTVATAMAGLISSGKAVTFATVLAAVFVASRGVTKQGLGQPEETQPDIPASVKVISPPPPAH